MIKDFLQDNSIQNRFLKTVYHFIYERGPVAKSEIVEKTKLNRSKVDRLIDDYDGRHPYYSSYHRSIAKDFGLESAHYCDYFSHLCVCWR